MIQDSDDHYELVHSPLERTLSGEGHTLRIAIYRGADEPDWILEIEDEAGTSTVFDERFASDQAALAAALVEIEAEGGIHRYFVTTQAEAMASEAEYFAKLDALEASHTRASTNVGRNETCPCGSGKKFKKCCGSPAGLH